MVNKLPDREETKKFWKSIGENEKKYNETAEWLPLIKKREATGSYRIKIGKNY